MVDFKALIRLDRKARDKAVTYLDNSYGKGTWLLDQPATLRDVSAAYQQGYKDATREAKK